MMQRYLLLKCLVALSLSCLTVTSIDRCNAQESKQPSMLNDGGGQHAIAGPFFNEPLQMNGLRHPMDEATELEKVAFQNAIDKYNVDIDTVQVSYVVTLQDVKQRIYIGFGVKEKGNNGKRLFLISDPVSTLGRKFHDRFSDEYRISSPGLPSPSPSAMRVLREGMLDLNGLEVKQIKREFESDPTLFGGKPLVPTGPRHPLTDANNAALDEVKRLYDVDFPAKDVLYARPLQDVGGREYTGFAVKFQKDSKFLISSGRTSTK